jgi:sigma-E factor negative regulatory protein RseA
MDRTETQELISALADGQLHGDAFARAVEAAAQDPIAREAWQAYHLIGDVLRSSDLAGHAAPDRFLAKLQQRLGEENKPVLALHAEAVQASALARPEAANDASLRWKMAAGFASVAAVAAIGWNMMGSGAQPGAQLAAVAKPAPVVAASQGGPMIRDAHLDQLLAAHRQLAGAPALQTSGGFLRNATFEGPAR